MKISEIKALIIPEIEGHCSGPIIMADDMGDIPTVAHATYKITTAFQKGVGRAEETYIENELGGLDIQRTEEFKTVISFTAYAMDEDESLDLAQEIYDWFAFQGYEFLSGHGITVADQTDVINRDAFVVENYERRNGFDVILRVKRVNKRAAEWFDGVNVK